MFRRLLRSAAAQFAVKGPVVRRGSVGGDDAQPSGLDGDTSDLVVALPVREQRDPNVMGDGADIGAERLGVGDKAPGHFLIVVAGADLRFTGRDPRSRSSVAQRRLRRTPVRRKGLSRPTARRLAGVARSCTRRERLGPGAKAACAAGVELAAAPQSGRRRAGRRGRRTVPARRARTCTAASTASVLELVNAKCWPGR